MNRPLARRSCIGQAERLHGRKRVRATHHERHRVERVRLPEEGDSGGELREVLRRPVTDRHIQEAGPAFMDAGSPEDGVTE